MIVPRDVSLFLWQLPQKQDGVQNLFGRVFGGETLPETVSGVTDSNIMTFLGMIEENTNNLLQVRR